MPRCQHEAATVEIELVEHFTVSQYHISVVQTVQMRLAVSCSACRFTGVYRAYPFNTLDSAAGDPNAAGDPRNWPKWLLRLVTVLRDQSPVIESACVDRSVPRLPAPKVAP